MLLRIASAAIGIPLAVAIVFVREPLALTVAVAVLSVLGVHEFYRGVRKLGYEPLEWLGWIACVIFVCSPSLLGHAHMLYVLPLGLAVELFRRSRAPIRNVGVTVLGALYAGWMFSFVVAMRNHGAMLLGWDAGTPEIVPRWFDFTQPGPLLVMYTLITVWACDTGAYFTGRFFGRHKLAPALSPGKTIEGFIGGLVVTTAVSVLIGGWLNFHVPTRIAIGLLIGVCCVIGDLIESAMKREIGVKDFGAIMPGHGGVLDRFDSLLFVAPVLVYVLFILNFSS